MLQLRGMVDGGQCLAGAVVANDPLLSQLLGVALHRGSINVFVSASAHPDLSSSRHPFFRPDRDESVFPQDIRMQGYILMRDCTLNGHRAFLLRTEQPGVAYAGPNRPVQTRLPQPNVMFEVFAETIPGIAYGVEVDLAFDPSPAALRRIDVPTLPFAAPAE